MVIDHDQMISLMSNAYATHCRSYNLKACIDTEDFLFLKNKSFHRSIYCHGSEFCICNFAHEVNRKTTDMDYVPPFLAFRIYSSRSKYSKLIITLPTKSGRLPCSKYTKLPRSRYKTKSQEQGLGSEQASYQTLAIVRSEAIR